MAAQLLGPRRRGRRGYQKMTEINVTPFVDVMLVLLIVFMVTAPLIIAGTAIDLPATAETAAMPDERTIIVRVAANGDIRVGRQTQPVAAELLVSEVQRLTGGDMAKPIVVLGDRQASYGQVAAVLGPLSAVGFTGLALGKTQGEGQPAGEPASPGKPGAAKAKRS